MKNKSYLRGISAAFATLFIAVTFVIPIAYENAGSINSALGLSGGNSSTDATADTMYYGTEYSDDGTLSEASQAKLLAAEIAYNVQVAQEGAVLVKNDDEALPLDVKSESNITLLGRASVDASEYAQSLKDAGFNVNQTVLDAYASSSTTADVSTNDIGEEPSTFYTSSITSTFSSYSDAAIIMFARTAAEGSDLAVSDADGVPQLSLHEDEKNLLTLAKNNGFKKIIVIINSGYAMELGWLEDYGVDACFWMSEPGDGGYTGIANLIIGEANFSGKFTDTYAENSLSSPAMMNYGDYSYTNASAIDSYGKGTNTASYVIQAEGIYTGYKYYETRYEDCVLDQGNADGSAGVYASKNNSWNYADEVVYTFGYGLSYTTFTQTLDEVTVDKDAQTITATVTVKNVGDVAGKSVVQLYAQLPYTEYDVENGVEKSSIQLVDFAKTEELQPGESTPITITADLYLIATYDENGANGGKGGYILDDGTYYFAIGDDAHDALNNVLANKLGSDASGKLYDADGAAVNGNADNAKTWVLEEFDEETFRYSDTGVEVTNQFDDQIDINDLMEGTVTYLTRNDWQGTYPITYDSITADESMFADLDGNTYETPSNAASVSSYTLGKSAGLNFVAMRNVDYNDTETWTTFLNQLSLEDLVIPICDSYGNEAVTSVGMPYHQNLDGIQHINSTYPYGDKSACTTYADECMSATTWSKELLSERGKFLAEDALYAGVPFVWSIGANLHRSPYSGRNYEYFSEDSIFTYHAGACVTKTMTEKGIIAGIKHFAANDQETNRMGVSTFMTEQTLRQNALKGFEGAVTVGKTLGIMSSYNRIGAVASCQSYQLQTVVLRDEWGFEGINVTDGALNTRYMHSIEGLVAGSDMFCMQPGRGSDFTKVVNSGDGYILECLRTANKHYYYAMSRSILINGRDENSGASEFTPWWKPALITVDCVLGVACLGTFGAYEFIRYRKKKEADV